MKPLTPEQYEKRVLLLVSGMSPQIVTETLFALVQPAKPRVPFIPTEVHLVTTATGAEQARLNLLEGREGKAQFLLFCKDYAIDPTIFAAANIHVITDAAGNELNDIRTPAENEATADFITRKVREFTSNNDTALHVSMAGGRKTMGYYAGYALSLFGRSQDRLSHVLVSEGYEGLRDFYYPTPKPLTIYDRHEKALDASKAKVSLATIPFVRLRDGLPESLQTGQHSFSQAVELAQLANNQLELRLFPARYSYQIAGAEGELSKVQFFLLLWAAERQQQNLPPITPLVDGEQNLDYTTEFLALEDRYEITLSTKTHSALLDGMTKEFIEPHVSRLNKTLTNQLGPRLASRCKLAPQTTQLGYGYALPEDLTIHIEQDLL